MRRQEEPLAATAAWSKPKTVAGRVLASQSVLERCGAISKGVEIHSTFCHHHQEKTYESWASAVPAYFRFAVKITHDARLRTIRPRFVVVVEEISALGWRLKLPRTLKFNSCEAERAFSIIRRFSGAIVIEPRHDNWAAGCAAVFLKEYAVDRVLAELSPVLPRSEFLETPRNVRLHGVRRIYHSSYTCTEIRCIANHLRSGSWFVLDNTASGRAIETALKCVAGRHHG